jgi:hypothetical protein
MQNKGNLSRLPIRMPENLSEALHQLHIRRELQRQEIRWHQTQFELAWRGAGISRRHRRAHSPPPEPLDDFIAFLPPVRWPNLYNLGSMADVPKDLLQQIQRLEELFTVDTARLKLITDHFISELEKGRFST